jgi:alginate O-acetyltransferase complex protein AlgI
MSAYLPSTPFVVPALALGLLIVLGWGFALGRLARSGIARGLAWAVLLLGTLGAERLVAHEPPGVRMLALVSVALLGMKIIVMTEERAVGMAPLSFGAWVGFAAAWLGMNPRLFGERAPGSLAGASLLVRRGLLNLLLGVVLVALARLVWANAESRLLATLLALPGLSLMVHFGLCHLLAGAWRLAGVAAEPLFRAPLHAQSLGEFWARRWNLGFSEMTTLAVYRPLGARLGRAPALVSSFALSGLLHELAISVPVRAGFGLPLLYFMLHGGLVLVERALAKSGHPLGGWVGRAWTIGWLLLPLPLLFHPPFLAGVVWPLIEPR